MEATVEANMMRRICVGDMMKRRALLEPKKEAYSFVYKGKVTRHVTFEELHEEANRFANAIMELGIKKGDRVAILSHNCPQFIDFIVALSKMGAWITPLNFALKGREITPLINHSEAIMFIVEDELVDTVRELEREMPSVRHYVMINLSGEKSLPPGWLDFDELCSEKYSAEEPCMEINGDDVMTLLYTSGTEAMPKGIMNSHANWAESINCFNMFFYGCDRRAAAAGQRITSEVILLGAAPLFHSIMIQYLTSLVMGHRFVLLHTPNPETVMSILQSGEITQFALSPTVVVNLLNMPNGEELVTKYLGGMEWAILYGSPATEPLLRRMIDALPNCRFRNYYGQTELTPLGCMLSYDDLVRKTKEGIERFGGAEAIGPPLPMVEMKIFDDNDNEVPVGTVGEIVVRSPCVMLGYYKEEEKTRETFRGGWHHTGDLGIMDEEGFSYFVDRKKDIIKTGGENVSSIEVEGWVAKHPKVSECTAVGLPHERWFEAVTMFVVPKTGESVTEEEIIQHCKEGLAGYKVPKKVVVLDELPKNPSGKVLKKDLRSEYKDAFASEK